MRGLVYKDMSLMMGNLRIYGLVCLVVFLVTGFTDGGMSFLVFYMTFCSGFMVLNTMTYDSGDNGMSYLMTLPVTRKRYVKEKYVFGLLTGGCGWGVAALLGTFISAWREPHMDWQQWQFNCASSFLSLLFILVFMVPVQLKYGAENGRSVIVGVVFGMTGVVYLLYNIFPEVGQILENILGYAVQAGLPATLGVGIVVSAFCLAVSLQISIGIMNKKEF